MDDESGVDERDGLTSGWGGESRQDWWGCRMEWIWKLISKTWFLSSSCISGISVLSDILYWMFILILFSTICLYVNYVYIIMSVWFLMPYYLYFMYVYVRLSHILKHYVILCISKWANCDFQGGDGWRARKSDNRWGAGTVRRLKRDKVVKIARLSSCNNFVSEREKFIFDVFVDL